MKEGLSFFIHPVHILLQPPANAFLIGSVRFVPNHLLKQLWSEWSEILAGAGGKQQVSLGFQVHLCTGYLKMIYGLQHTKNNSYSYTQQLQSRKDMREQKEVGRDAVCRRPYLNSSGRTEWSSQWRQLPTIRIIDGIHVMQGNCLKVFVPIYAVWIQQEWSCVPRGFWYIKLIFGFHRRWCQGQHRSLYQNVDRNNVTLAY